MRTTDPLTIHASAWGGKVKCEKHGVHDGYISASFDPDTILCQRCYWEMLIRNGVSKVEKHYGADAEQNYSGR
jgi:hypothetical protein